MEQFIGEDVMEDEQKRIDVILLGVKIGTASGWDEMDVAVFFFYDFEPAEGVSIPAGGINVDLNTGIVELYEDETEGTVLFGLLDVLHNMNRNT